MPTTVSLVNNGDGTSTLTVESTYNTTKLTNLGGDAGEYFYNVRHTLYEGEGDATTPIPWENLTNQQKLDVLGQEFVFHMKNGGASGYINDATKTANEQAKDQVVDRYV